MTTIAATPRLERISLLRKLGYDVTNERHQSFERARSLQTESLPSRYILPLSCHQLPSSRLLTSNLLSINTAAASLSPFCFQPPPERTKGANGGESIDTSSILDWNSWTEYRWEVKDGSAIIKSYNNIAFLQRLSFLVSTSAPETTTRRHCAIRLHFRLSPRC